MNQKSHILVLSHDGELKSSCSAQIVVFNINRGNDRVAAITAKNANLFILVLREVVSKTVVFETLN